MSNDAMDWGHEEEVMDDVTIKELNELCLKAKKLKEEAAELKKQKADKEEEYKKVSHKIIAYLDHFGMTSHAGEDFGKVSKARGFSVPSPQGDKKQEFFEFLKSRGDFEGMASINHNTLNAYVRKEIEESSGKPIYDDKLTVAEIEQFTPPGLEKPKIHYTMRLSKK